MKRYFSVFLVSAVSALLLFTSCQKETLSEDSIITVDAMELNDFDKWLEVNFVHPYNIEFKYRYENNETSLDYYTVPADYDNSIVMAHLVKYLCIDSYDEVAGAMFTRKYFPKEFFLMGEWEYKNNGVYTLGTAEGGKKIILMGINYLDNVMDGSWGVNKNDLRRNLNYYYLKTIHHEFTHILNQTKDYPVSFDQVSGSSENGYVTDSWSDAQYNDNLEKGFISKYARSSPREDFAEMMSIYVTNSQEWWNSQMEAAGESGSSLIGNKLEIVKEYMSETFDIDLDRLREVVLRRQDEVVSGKVDLSDLSI